MAYIVGVGLKRKRIDAVGEKSTPLLLDTANGTEPALWNGAKHNNSVSDTNVALTDWSPKVIFRAPGRKL